MRSLLFFSFLLSILSIPCRSQTGKTGIGIHVGAVDFYGPQTGRYLLNEYRPGDTMKHGSRLFWEPNIAVSIQRIIHPHGVWSVQASFLRVHYPSSHPDSLYILHKQGFLPSLSTPYYFPLQSTLSYSLFSFSRNRKINALVSGGIGYTAGRVQIPVGISVLVRVAPRWRVEWSSAYWIKANDWAVPGI
ncbi:MAG TPA: hypothetical protein PLP34_07725, partial [Chitinophagaceae bacterium]|nr:hypothetical protein [Chitinophagaceae bacterium]